MTSTSLLLAHTLNAVQQKPSPHFALAAEPQAAPAVVTVLTVDAAADVAADAAAVVPDPEEVSVKINLISQKQTRISKVI